MSTLLVYIPIYDADIVVHFGDLTSLHDWLKENTTISSIHDLLSEIEKNEHLGITVSGGSDLIVRLPEEPHTSRDFGTLIHELSHAVNIILKRAGISPSDESEEAYTYLLGYLTCEVFDALKVSISAS